MQCQTLSDILTIAGGATGLIGAAIVVSQVIGDLRSAPQLVALAGKSDEEPQAKPRGSGTEVERLEELETRVGDLEIQVTKVETQVAKALTETAATRLAMARTNNVLQATVAFVTKQGFWAVFGAFLVVISVIAATAGGVVANHCGAKAHGAYVLRRSSIASTHGAQKPSHWSDRIRQSYSPRWMPQQKPRAPSNVPTVPAGYSLGLVSGRRQFGLHCVGSGVFAPTRCAQLRLLRSVLVVTFGAPGSTAA
jgi:hypothetical protein